MLSVKRAETRSDDRRVGYKESMKSSLRERAYIMISFGLVNQEAQAKATADNGSYAYYSNTVSYTHLDVYKRQVLR